MCLYKEYKFNAPKFPVKAYKVIKANLDAGDISKPVAFPDKYKVGEWYTYIYDSELPFRRVGDITYDGELYFQKYVRGGYRCGFHTLPRLKDAYLLRKSYVDPEWGNVSNYKIFQCEVDSITKYGNQVILYYGERLVRCYVSRKIRLIKEV